jgi:hypothetical protein
VSAFKLWPGARGVSIDPGKTSGVCSGEVTGKFRFTVSQCIEVPWDNRFEGVTEAIRVVNPDFVVMERFRVYAHKAADLVGSENPSSQVIGIVELYLWQRQQLDILYYQNASERKAAGVLPEHKHLVMGSAHKVDAYQHLRTFIILNSRHL